MSDGDTKHKQVQKGKCRFIQPSQSTTDFIQSQQQLSGKIMPPFLFQLNVITCSISHSHPPTLTLSFSHSHTQVTPLVSDTKPSSATTTAATTTHLTPSFSWVMSSNRRAARDRGKQTSQMCTQHHDIYASVHKIKTSNKCSRQLEWHATTNGYISATHV